MKRTIRRVVALVYGLACHGGFGVAVFLMITGLFTGMQSGRGPFTGASAWLANLLLVLQFPLIHSTLLTRSGRKALGALAPVEWRRPLGPTLYACSAALQIGLTFLLWSPSGVVLYEPHGTALVLHCVLFGLAWAFLGKALFDAGLGLQTGWIGWSAVWRDAPPAFPGLPTAGLFARCRQPIYLGFALVLWTAPTWTPDRLLIAITWSLYCAIGPLHKERRFQAAYGAAFEAYRQRTPYILPRIF